jgi:hypothetical protein
MLESLQRCEDEKRIDGDHGPAARELTLTMWVMSVLTLTSMATMVDDEIKFLGTQQGKIFLYNF